MLYNPPQFRDGDAGAPRAFVEAVGFATLVTLGEAEGARELDVTALPLLWDEEGGEPRLIGHVSRANPQWKRLAAGVSALAVFQAHDHYVSPAWYPAKREHGKVVPTWNYELVAVWGRLATTEDPAALERIVTRLTERHEARRGPGAEPWAVSDAPADFVAGMLKGIVGLTLSIERIEGKRKLSQNRPEPDKAGVREGLEREGTQGAGSVAAALAAFDRANGG